MCTHKNKLHHHSWCSFVAQFFSCLQGSVAHECVSEKNKYQIITTTASLITLKINNSGVVWFSPIVTTQKLPNLPRHHKLYHDKTCSSLFTQYDFIFHKILCSFHFVPFLLRWKQGREIILSLPKWLFSFASFLKKQNTRKKNGWQLLSWRATISFVNFCYMCIRIFYIEISALLFPLQL